MVFSEMHGPCQKVSSLKTEVFRELMTRRGFEPRTHCLKGSCSAN